MQDLLSLAATPPVGGALLYPLLAVAVVAMKAARDGLRVTGRRSARSLGARGAALLATRVHVRTLPRATACRKAGTHATRSSL